MKSHYAEKMKKVNLTLGKPASKLFGAQKGKQKHPLMQPIQL